LNWIDNSTLEIESKIDLILTILESNRIESNCQECQKY